MSDLIAETHKAVDDLVARAVALKEDNDRLRAALKDVFDLIEEGWLVRDTAHDDRPGWGMRHLPFVRRLQQAEALLTSGLQESGKSP